MKNAYIYPNVYVDDNPYLQDFVKSLASGYRFLNLKKPGCLGILSAFIFMRKADIMFFNWIEDLPDKRGGRLQTYAFLFILNMLKRRKIKVFYTLHNRESHYPTNKKLKEKLFNTILQKADYILSHSSEGAEILIKKNIPLEKFLYLPHPFNTVKVTSREKDKRFDILIWGALKPYKGIDSYLKYLESQNLLNKYKTRIVGKIYPADYEKELMRFKSDSIDIQNRYIDDDKLNDMIDKSRIVLFTYKESSVLSSGALIYTLGRGANVIGPDTAAFSDLGKEGLLKTYDTYPEMIDRIDEVLKNPFSSEEKINEYITENSWKNLGNRICCWIGDFSRS